MQSVSGHEPSVRHYRLQRDPPKDGLGEQQHSTHNRLLGIVLVCNNKTMRFLQLESVYSVFLTC